MKSDKINYLEPKTKDFESWKTDQPYHDLKTKNFLKREYDKYQIGKELLKTEGIPQILRCPNCMKTEETEIIVMPDFKFKDYYCESCLEEKEKEDLQEQKKKEQKKVADLRSDRQRDFLEKLPPRYYGIMDSKKSESENNSSCTIFYGGFGTGKTWRAYKIAYDLYLSSKIDGYKHITEVGMINEIKAGFNNNTFDSRVESFKNVDLLIVDEMGKNNDSDFNKAQIFEILNHRYDWEKKTILICNCEEKKELYEILSDAILDRFREEIILMDGESRRYAKQ